MKIIKYSLLVAIAVLVNLSTQYCSDLIYVGALGPYISLLLGTLAGLVTKYSLDKRYIFYHSSTNLTHDLRTFILYSIMGIFTTLVFWGVELSFHYVASFSYAKYVGGLMGLTIGYTLKYTLDKRYVFVRT